MNCLTLENRSENCMINSFLIYHKLSSHKDKVNMVEFVEKREYNDCGRINKKKKKDSVCILKNICRFMSSFFRNILRSGRTFL